MSHVRKYRSQLFLVMFTLFICWFFVLRHGVFGSKVDWISQHSVIPEYFRQLYYSTGDLFPDFAYHIGGGQNIYNFSYYGLYSPVILFSYLLPFVKMSDYIMAVSMISLAASAVLFFTWLKSRGFASGLCVGVSCIFILASPMVYHSYNHIMFVNYMPFLCMALIGVDRYLKDGKWGVYLLGTFLMIMTSFYFSIGGILALILYGIYCYMELRCKVKISQFITDGIRFLIPAFLAVMLSGVLLVPTAMALMGGQREKTADLSFAELLFPEIHVLRFVYSPYGIGLTALVFVVLISCIFYPSGHTVMHAPSELALRDKVYPSGHTVMHAPSELALRDKVSPRCYEKILAYGVMVICIIPIFGYLLNGGLYAKDKVFLPFLPIFCYLIADYLRRMQEGKLGSKRYIFPFLITLVLFVILREQGEFCEYWKLAVAEAGGALLLFLLFGRKRNIYLFMLPTIGIMLIIGSVMNPERDYILSREFYEDVTDSSLSDLTEKISEDDDGAYRMEQHGSVTENAANLNRIQSVKQAVSSIYSSVYNKEYQKFRTETYQLNQPFRNAFMQSVSENPLFLKFMGVKYIISDDKPYGYEFYMESEGKKVWVDPDAAPICYVTNQVMGEEQYKRLSFPYNQTALAEYAVVQGQADEVELQSKVKEIELDVPIKISGGTQIALPEEVQAGQILFLQFDVRNLKSSQDVELTIGRIRNKLSAGSHEYYNGNTRFTYVTGIEDGQRNLEITHTKGEYEISHVKAYVAEIDEESEETLYQNPVTLSEKETKDDNIVGDVKTEEEGYFVSSIPYDENFVVKVDGKEVAYEKVNTAFLGFKINEGEHHIEITYHAPGAAAGKMLSIAGLLGVMILALFSKNIIRSRR